MPVAAQASGPDAAPDRSAAPSETLLFRQPRQRVIFALVIVSLLMTSIDANIVGTALPVFHDELHAPVNWASWTITIYALGFILGMPLAGKLSDQYGRRRVFLVSVATFTAASLGCGLANNIYLLVALRAIQALGGSGLMPSAVGIVVDNFGPRRDRAIAMFASLVPMGAVIGPLLGGVLMTYWSWRGIFLINVPIGVFVLLLGARHIPRDSKRFTAGPFDFRGMTLLGVLILSAMVSITYLGGRAATVDNAAFVVPVTIAVATGWLFVRQARTAAAPFIPRRLLSGPGFRVMNLINFCYGAVALGFPALIPIYATERYGIPILGSGTLLCARAIGMSSIALVATMALRRTGYRLPMTVGCVATFLGMAAMAVPPPIASPYAWLFVASLLCGIGNGLAAPASTNAGLQLAPEHAAAVTGLRGTFRQAGSITAVSITAAIVARSVNPGIGEAYMFAVFAVLLLCMLPLIARIPDHRGSW